MTSTTIHDRVLPLQGVHNFRDYGGYGAAGGGQVKRGVLWRSGQHGEASDADLAAIAALELATVIDLRGNTERSHAPCRRPDGFAAEVLFFDGETAGLGSHVDAAAGVLTEEQARAAMRSLYAGIAYRPNLVDVLRRYFAALQQRDGASLVHCLAGKDRTGFAVALLHHVLGVHPDDAMADYLLTKTAGNIEKRIAAGAAPIRAKYGQIDDGAIRALMGVEAEYLDTAWAALKDSHGGLDRYLAEVLGVGPAERAALLERFVEG